MNVEANKHLQPFFLKFKQKHLYTEKALCMIEPPQYFSARREEDFKDIQLITSLVVDMGLHTHPIIRDSVERLVKAVGTKQFYLEFSVLYDFVHRTDSAIESMRLHDFSDTPNVLQSEEVVAAMFPFNGSLYFNALAVGSQHNQIKEAERVETPKPMKSRSVSTTPTITSGPTIKFLEKYHHPSHSQYYSTFSSVEEEEQSFARAQGIKDGSSNLQSSFNYRNGVSMMDED